MTDNDKLKQQALEILANKGIDADLYQQDLTQLVEDLSIHRIELEQQNHSLRKINDDLELLQEKYSDLFNNAPIGYLIMDAQHIILEINDMGCQLLLMKKPDLIHSKLTKFIDPEFQDNFYLYFKKVNNKFYRKSIDLAFRISNGHQRYMRLIGIPNNEEDDNIKLALVDITSEKELEYELDKYRNSLENIVEQRTKDLEIKNKELDEKNKELEKYRQLYKESEIRIAELKEALNRI